MACVASEHLGGNGIRVVSLVQAETVTGPMKPLLMFAKNTKVACRGRRALSHSVMTTGRIRNGRAQTDNRFLKAAAAIGLAFDLIDERFPFDPAILPAIARRLTNRDPDIIESHDSKSHFLVWLLKKSGRFQGKHWLAFHHGYTQTSRRVRLYQQLDRVSLRAADGVVTVCAPFAQELVERGVERERIRVLVNAIEIHDRLPPSECVELRRRLGLEPSHAVILTVGRLSAEKGHAILLKAYRRLAERMGTRDLRLVIVGEGEEGARLRAESAELAGRVVFTGQVEDPWPYYCMADLFALPSYSEGSPLALFEAMSAGLPIVASSVGGIPETVSDLTSALLVAPGSAEALAGALERFLRDSDLARRVGEGALAAAERFSPEKYTQDRLSIYEALLGGRKPSG